ncbi:class I SAM-dependent methyltransferase [Capillimicrobium parvum]|uniref:2-methoxy-6-polyprenyl-1,4-benzoquinol methylase, mitochondrial n=1 Tax=Capillimicrobium parvum TaxID=2884022 RepID=A0A9E6XXI2_9ACTN|nr:methyltransferase domain-containing protein [Capillimicrobium parvum]UGS36259.1 2-methoxy-6-polyprenyl-1,4-benzoquinol methylase, mitochondrial [Capillimicrobium parvum]
MAQDPDDFRSTARDRWERAAQGWGNQRGWWDRSTEPVSAWMIEAIDPQPGQTILELAAGPGDVGLRIADRIKPEGRVIATDGAEAMVEVLRERAHARGLSEVVEAKAMEAEWIDLAAASVDAVVCRWGYMLLADPGAALRETRRVLKPGGRLALAAWDEPKANPWSSAVGRELADRGLIEVDPAAPGQFFWRDQAVITEALEDAGFTDVTVDTVRFTLQYQDPDSWWDVQIDMSPVLANTLVSVDPAARDDIMEAAQAQLAEYEQEDGSLEVPASAHVARAEA